ncbi:MAG TPA: C-type lectin domain-containing protein [Polyangiaceae bacterium]|nr:C-type lectin domain-containing protein [Polyangiaceae bacterium]
MSWGRLVLFSGVFVACRFGYQELDGNGAALATAGGAGSTGATNGGGAAASASTPVADGGDAGQNGTAGGDGGQASTAGGSAGATNVGSGATGGSGSAGGTSGGGVSSAGTSAAGGGSCGTDPCPAGCEGHEYGGHLYAFCSTPLVRADAEAACESMGLRLVRVDDVDELTWLRGVCFAAVGSNNSSTVWPWLGANDLAVDGEWRWADGIQFWQGTQTGGPVGGLFENWAQGQPVSKDSCATMQNNATDSLWSTQPCASVHPYTCEGG